MKRTVSVLAVALLVVLAGCSGGGSPGATTADSGDGGSDGTTQGAGDGSSDSGDVSFVDDREAALKSAGSYTSVWRMTSTRGDETREMAYTTKLDYENERYDFEMVTTTDGVTENAAESFFADGVSYSRFGEGEDAQYSSNAYEFSNIVPGGQIGFVASSHDLSDFSYEGTETFDGVQVERYEMTQAATWLSGSGGGQSDVKWTDFSYVVLVDDRGLVRSETWTGNGVTGDGVDVSIEYTYELTAVGSTTIPDPSWLENATSQ